MPSKIKNFIFVNSGDMREKNKIYRLWRLAKEEGRD
jgi:hypothetical protein